MQRRDLLKLAGVSYHVGREANAQFGETLNGVQTKQATKHQLMKGIDPYVKPGDKSSGLLPGVHAGPPGEEGSADKRVQVDPPPNVHVESFAGDRIILQMRAWVPTPEYLDALRDRKSVV